MPQLGGERIIQPVMHQSNNSGLWYTGDDVLNTTMRNLNTAAEYLWASYDIPVVVTFTDTIKNAGDPRILSLVAVSIEGTEMSAADDLGTALFNTGSNAKALGGLRLVVSTTGSPGNISQTSNSWWQAKPDTSTSALTLYSIRNVISDTTIDKSRPSILIGDRDMFDRTVDLIQPAQRFQDDKTANAGFENIMVAGVPFVIDSHCPSTHLFVLTENYIKMVYTPEENFKLYPFQMPVNQKVMIARLGWSGNMVYSNPRMLGALTNISS